jgi:hypothetical protein
MKASATYPAGSTSEPHGIAIDAATDTGVLSLIGYGFAVEIITQRLTEIP